MDNLINLFDNIETKRKVICITGGIAEGKSISMSTIANELKSELNADLFSNYKLSNSLDITEFDFTRNNMNTIVCIDEFGYVLHYSPYVIDTIDLSEEKNIIFIIEAFDINRIPENVRKLIDLHLSVKKDDGTIMLKGVNVAYERVISIHHNKDLYDAFSSPKFEF